MKAESTNITDVSYPAHAMFDLEHRTTDPPLLVKATVSFYGSEPGYFLSIGIFDLDSGDSVKGGGSASPNRCNLVNGYAMCLMEIKSSSGVEHVEFNIAGFKPTMSLAIVAVLFNATGTLIYESESDYEFAINLTSSLILSIMAPSIVSVSVDGIPQPEGSVQLNLIPGVHRITVPDIAQLSNVTRLKFEQWSDGLNQTNRTITLSKQTMLTATYATQYLIADTNSQGNATGSEWYNEGSTATFSVSSATMPMSGILGLMGGKWNFQGWYENGRILTASINIHVIVHQSRSLTARWEPDYALPALAFSAIAFAIIIALIRGNSWKVRRRKRRN